MSKYTYQWYFRFTLLSGIKYLWNVIIGKKKSFYLDLNFPSLGLHLFKDVGLWVYGFSFYLIIFWVALKVVKKQEE
jgi:hypothetical protein